MRYAVQIQGAMARLDQTLFALNRIVKNDQVREAVEYMETGPLREAFEDLQSIIQLEAKEDLGARGTKQTGTL